MISPIIILPEVQSSATCNSRCDFRRSVTVLLFAGLLLLNQRCAEENEALVGAVQITFDVASAENETTDRLLSEGTLLVSIERSGNKIFDFEELTFSRNGSAFITERLDLEPGSYLIKDFVLVDANGQILFAVPRKNTTVAASLADGLFAHSFHVRFQANVHTHVQMLSVSKHQPKDFGYASFRLNRKILNIGVKVQNGKDVRFTTADAFIMKGRDTLSQYVLSARMNHIPFNGDANETYELVIIKDGYGRYTETLEQTGRGGQSMKNIIVTLPPALTLTATTLPDGYFAFQIDGYPGQVVLDWGDGTTQAIDFSDPLPSIVRSHTYEAVGTYFISVTGDLSQVIYMEFQGDGEPDRVHIEWLTEVEDVRFLYTNTPKFLDASRNLNLTSLIFWSTGVEFVKISSERPPFNIELEDSRNVTTAAIDGIINDVYDYAVRTGIGHRFISWGYHSPVDGSYLALGPPSPETLDKMKILQDVYDCEFVPLLDEPF